MICLFKVHENSIEQRFAANIVQCCQGSTILLHDKIEQCWPAPKHCSMLFSSTLNKLYDDIFPCILYLFVLLPEQ